MKNKKGQTAGLITTLVFGIVALIVGVIIAFVVVSTLSGADLLNQYRSSETEVNERSLTGTVFINSTGYTLLRADDTTTNFAITSALNYSNDEAIVAANYTLSSTGVLTNATSHTWDNVSINYTYDVLTNEEQSTTWLTTNFTSGVDNVSAKIPTVLLVAAIVLILGVLVVLVAVWQKMRFGGSGTI